MTSEGVVIVWEVWLVDVTLVFSVDVTVVVCDVVVPLTLVLSDEVTVVSSVEVVTEVFAVPDEVTVSVCELEPVELEVIDTEDAPWLVVVETTCV